MAIPNQNPNNNISCPDTSGIKTLIFSGSDMDIIQGSATLLQIALKDFFIPLDIYGFQELTVKAGTNIEVPPCNVASVSGEVQFIAIIVDYPINDTGAIPIPTEDKYLTFQYPEGGKTMPIGKIMILSGSTKPGFGWELVSSPGKILISNPHLNFDVVVRILVFN